MVRCHYRRVLVAVAKQFWRNEAAYFIHLQEESASQSRAHGRQPPRPQLRVCRGAREDAIAQHPHVGRPRVLVVWHSRHSHLPDLQVRRWQKRCSISEWLANSCGHRLEAVLRHHRPLQQIGDHHLWRCQRDDHRSRWRCVSFAGDAP